MINRFLIAVLLLAAPVGAAGAGFASPQNSVAFDYRTESQDSVALDYRTVMLQEMLRKAETQRRDYRFSDAVRTCEEAMSLAAEPQQQRLVAEALALARNGDSMTDYCSTPKVVARKLLSLSDFYLYYPLEPASWRPLPEGLASALGVSGDPLAGTGPEESAAFSPVYIPQSAIDEGRIIFAAKGDIYITENDSQAWSAPQLLSESLTSSGNEVFPILADGGKTLYFSSDGLYGMGGYDIYVCHWDERKKCWGEPVNMGFPYSSPYDDFLFLNTPDGRYSMFASNRECPSGSVYVYVVEYEATPVRKGIYDPARLKGLLDMPKAKASASLSPGMREYVSKLQEIKTLQDSIAAFGQAIETSRAKLAGASGVSHRILVKDILRREQELPGMEEQLALRSQELQEIEIDLVMNGETPDPSLLPSQSSASAFDFTRRAPGEPLEMVVRDPEPVFDFTFAVLPQGRLYKDVALPQGVVYQVQMSVMTTALDEAGLHGLSPVFETVSAGKYTYSAGLFHTYDEALAALPVVRKAGFKKAFIAAYVGGARVSLSEARAAEATLARSFVLRIHPDSGNSLDSSTLEAIRAASSADLQRSTSGGSVFYLLGPIPSAAEASSIADRLRSAAGLTIDIIPAN